jgi:hypothetical protein
MSVLSPFHSLTGLILCVPTEGQHHITDFLTTPSNTEGEQPPPMGIQEGSGEPGLKKVEEEVLGWLCAGLEV